MQQQKEGLLYSRESKWDKKARNILRGIYSFSSDHDEV
jgi:hypothetical protein